MVTGQFYQQVTDAIRTIAARRGNFTLAMLLPSSSHDADEWNAVFSAVWLDPLSLREAIKVMMNGLEKQLDRSAFSRLQRVSVLRTTEPFVREVTEDLAIPEPGTAYRVQSFAFSRFGVEEAVVFVAAPPPRAQNPQGSIIRNTR